ncbi:hypothetical protein EBU58_12610 [bacterium]|nr:hypothetical protein [bacterium]
MVTSAPKQSNTAVTPTSTIATACAAYELTMVFLCSIKESFSCEHRNHGGVGDSRLHARGGFCLRCF